MMINELIDKMMSDVMTDIMRIMIVEFDEDEYDDIDDI